MQFIRRTHGLPGFHSGPGLELGPAAVPEPRAHPVHPAKLDNAMQYERQRKKK